MSDLIQEGKDLIAGIVNPTPSEDKAVTAGADDCPNCANNGNIVKLNNHVCGSCGYTTPISSRAQEAPSE
jgi:ribosomal protein S27AE